MNPSTSQTPRFRVHSLVLAALLFTGCQAEARQTDLQQRVDALPDSLAAAYAVATPLWDTGVTMNMMEGSGHVMDTLVGMLVALSEEYPDGHFGGGPATDFFNGMVRDRAAWHRALLEPDGIGTGGTIVGPLASQGVMDDLERAVHDMVHALFMYDDAFDLAAWTERWKAAQQPG